MPGLSFLFVTPRAARLPVSCLLLAASCLAPAFTLAQDEAFLRCADLGDRTARVACLEQALDAAVAARATAQSQPVAPPPAVPAPAAPTAPPVRETAQQSPAPAASAPATAQTVTPPPPPAAAEESSRLRDVFGWFGRDRNEEGEDVPEIAETMQATVTELELYKPDIWTITLDSGQVWRQLYADRYNLRVGDAITITRATGRLQYRLEAERFNGFIRVERLR